MSLGIRCISNTRGSSGRARPDAGHGAGLEFARSGPKRDQLQEGKPAPGRGHGDQGQGRGAAQGRAEPERHGRTDRQDAVVMDTRNPIQKNKDVLINYLKSLPAEKRAKILIFK